MAGLWPKKNPALDLNFQCFRFTRHDISIRGRWTDCDAKMNKFHLTEINQHSIWRYLNAQGCTKTVAVLHMPGVVLCIHLLIQTPTSVARRALFPLLGSFTKQKHNFLSCFGAVIKVPGSLPKHLPPVLLWYQSYILCCLCFRFHCQFTSGGTAHCYS